MKTNRLFSIVSILVLCLTATAFQVRAQQPASRSTSAGKPVESAREIDLTTMLAQARRSKTGGFSLMAESRNHTASGPVFSITPMSTGPGLPVTGSGTLGRLPKWTGFTSSNAAISDSSIYASEDPSSNRRGASMIIAPMSSSSLPVIGTGTAGRLAKWVGSAGSNSVIGDTAIYEDKLGKVGIGTDSPTSRLTVTGGIESTAGGFKFPDGSVQTTSAAGSLLTVSHDATLIGGGTSASPLGLTVPLRLRGSASPPSPGTPAQILEVVNTGSGVGVTGRGAPGLLGLGSPAAGIDGIGGIGMTGVGGDSTGPNGRGGAGVTAVGGGSDGVGGDGILAFAGSGNAPGGLAGRFVGSVSVSGTLSKGGGMFHIDHPLDPENKYLNHSFVESPDMKNIYDGTTTTDAKGEAVVELPDWFEALNKDFRYQLTVIGTFAQAIVAEEVTDNRFAIKTNAPNVRVSWQVTGIRRDAFANRNRIRVEEEKPEVERGYYLHPEAFGQPEEKSINWARDPEVMMRLKQRRNDVEQPRKR